MRSRGGEGVGVGNSQGVGVGDVAARTAVGSVSFKRRATLFRLRLYIVSNRVPAFVCLPFHVPFVFGALAATSSRSLGKRNFPRTTRGQVRLRERETNDVAPFLRPENKSFVQREFFYQISPSNPVNFIVSKRKLPSVRSAD